MKEYVRYEGKAAVDWIDQHCCGYWMVTRYERSTRMLVVNYRQEDQTEIGYLVLRGVRAADIIGHVGGNATFTFETSLAEQDPAPARKQVLRIAGDDHDGSITFNSFAVYAMSNRRYDL